VDEKAKVIAEYLISDLNPLDYHVWGAMLEAYHKLQKKAINDRGTSNHIVEYLYFFNIFIYLNFATVPLYGSTISTNEMPLAPGECPSRF